MILIFNICLEIVTKLNFLWKLDQSLESNPIYNIIY